MIVSFSLHCITVTVIHHNSLLPQYFPDRFVWREILSLTVVCLFNHLGCNWEGKYEHYQQHIDSCQFATSTCQHCREKIHKSQMKSHSQSCQFTPKLCPLAPLGCTKVAMVSDKLQQHLKEDTPQHLTMIASYLLSLEAKLQVPNTKSLKLELQGLDSQKWNPDFVEADGAVSTNRYDSRLGQCLGQQSCSKTQFVARLQERAPSGLRGDLVTQEKLESVMAEMKKELMRNFRSELKVKDEEITELKTRVSKSEKMVRSKNAELEDRDFRLSLIENSNHDGSMIWKIPQFSQRKADAENGKYTSIFSLPFYSGRYGYRMCLRLYIMGDGIGKSTHLSLFFVVMRGEFDNILQWPFTHKVTFKLINQAGGRDIVDTFQPDPMSSSFRKPKSDMNIASGCPRFVSHTELERGGFIVNDTIFIKCSVDTSTICHP